MDIKTLQPPDFDFWTIIDTRWRDMDSLSHINHATYLSYMESARVDVYIELGFSGIRREMDESTILASMEVHYLNQATHPSKLEIGHRISRVGNKSFDFISSIFDSQDKRPICAALFKLVAYNYKTDRTIPVPELIRERCRPI
ncbi:MAG: thioesterase family protein [Candidatus Marinimicrobia bacterium]|jgi:acyl-CoA thioester hydrolase|nr:thioesterase family protein [Candidatus Neomarinimicrobiota bacterium]|tara:strand:+ start:3114 stop:3542 length:429 start_codon:yes stop_codon:yes gene_type:complete